VCLDHWVHPASSSRYSSAGPPTIVDPTNTVDVMSATDCVFCGIAAGVLPSTQIAESERALAFLDINPVTRGHALVIPRAHAQDLFDTPPTDLTACAELGQLVAQRAMERLGADGVNLLNCSGAAAWQTVFHVHLHVIPRYADDPERDRIGPPWEIVPSDLDEIQRIGTLLS
jgi:histidine triad (HIT) family protein